MNLHAYRFLTDKGQKGNFDVTEAPKPIRQLFPAFSFLLVRDVLESKRNVIKVCLCLKKRVLV